MAEETEKILFQIILDQVAASKNLGELKKQLREMIANLPTDKNSEGFKIMSQGAKLLRDEISKLEGATKANTQSLGGINENAKLVKGSYDELRAQIKGAKSDLGAAVIGTDDFNKKQNELNLLLQKEIDLRKEQPSLFQERVKGAVVEANSISGITQKLNDLVEQSKKLNITSEQFKALQDEINKTRVELGQAEGRIDSFGKRVKNSTAETIEDFGKFAAGVTASFGVVETIFGKNEQTQQALLKVTQAIQLVQAVRAITEGVLASKTVITTIATGAQTLATKGLELAQRALNAAMNSNVFLAIAGAIITLTGLILTSTKVFGSNTEEVKRNTDAINDNADAQELLNRDLRSTLEKDLLFREAKAKRELEFAEKSGASEEIIFQREQDVLRARLTGLKILQDQKQTTLKEDIEIANIENTLGADAIKRQAEEIKAEEEKAKKIRELKQKSFDELFAFQVQQLERQSEIDQLTLAAAVEAERQRIELQIATLKEGDELRLQLRLQTLQTEEDAALALVTTGSQQEANIKEEFRQKEQAAIDEHFTILRNKVANENAEKLTADIINLELNHQSTVAKEIELETAEFERIKNEKIIAGQSIELLEAQHQKNLTDLNRKAAGERANIVRQEFELQRNILSAYSSLGEILAGNEQELSEFARGVALFNIGLNTAESIAGIVKTVTTKDPDPTGVSQAILITAQVAAVLGQIAAAKKLITGSPKAPELQKFDSGGSISYSGGDIPFWGGMITGNSHSSGGVRFSMGNKIGEADGKKGEAYIINTSHDPFLKAAASAINVAGGGKSFYNNGGAFKFQDGGIAARAASDSTNISQQIAASLAQQFERLPAPVVFVEDINTGQTRVSRIEERASI